MATAVSAEPPEDSSGPDGEAAAGAASVEIDSVLLAFDGDPVLRGLSLEVRPGEVMALLGPSGCGKTTLLRVVAGLEEPEAGEVRMSGRLLTSPGKVVAPEKRDVAMVFQDWALFPHMTVAENVGFGLPRGQRRSSPLIARTLDLVGLGGLGERMPESLSGGQQQRVALGRALAQRPAVLLLDEPFSNLDPTLRGRVRSDVKEVLREVGVTTVLVTHDRDEAFVLGDRVAVMRDGAISQVDTPEALYLRPRDEWVADFVGELNGARRAGSREPLRGAGEGRGAPRAAAARTGLGGRGPDGRRRAGRVPRAPDGLPGAVFERRASRRVVGSASPVGRRRGAPRHRRSRALLAAVTGCRPERREPDPASEAR
jgi:ABC-type Fe3+/spermidine/putrescine transport system ATPase subunit